MWFFNSIDGGRRRAHKSSARSPFSIGNFPKLFNNMLKISPLGLNQFYHASEKWHKCPSILTFTLALWIPYFMQNCLWVWVLIFNLFNFLVWVWISWLNPKIFRFSMGLVWVLILELYDVWAYQIGLFFL